ncbi:MAG: arsenic resistance protein [Deltaproteobacteria bacterium]|nr:arsenic resistance protein [Deltaproteobacteria bacterium]MBM4324247.1 arsenic resistance protein [Deltaproteobacteria bacterium]MBM4347587.1 arsenic resistance protein [Deltaproteobacteria bacterium]
MAHLNNRVKPLRLIRDMSCPAVLLLAAAVGLALSVWSNGARSIAGQLITPFLMLVLFSIFTRVSLTRLREAVRDRQYLLTAMGLNFVSTPFVAFFLGWLFLRDYPSLWVGLMLALVTPCTDWYLIFTDLAGGDLHRNLALLPWNLILQLVLLPVYLFLLTQKLVPVELSTLARAFALYVVIPLTGAQLLRWYRPQVAASERFSRLGFAALGLTVMAMFTSHGEIFLKNPTLFLRMAPPMLSFYIISISLSRIVSRLLHFPRERFIALACTTTARNSPLALPLAVVLFPDHPIIALSQLIEPVLEIPSLILFSSLVRVRVQKTKI